MKPWRYGSVSDLLGPNSAEFYVAYMLGRSFVGMRTEDILVSSRYLSDRFPDVDQRVLTAHGELTVPALHAAALEPGRFDEVLLKQGLVSWQDVATTPRHRRQLINTVHGALGFYDLFDLRRLIGRDRLKEFDNRWADGGVIVID